MWLYPVPVIVSVLIWAYILFSTGYAIWGSLIALAGVVVYWMKGRLHPAATR